MKLSTFFILYFFAVNLLSAVITIADKYNAKHHKRRVPEDFLLTIGLAGGAAAEYITMKIIHHKIRHKKFMLGLPAEIITHIILLILVLYLIKH